MSGTASIVLNVAQYLSLGLVINAGWIRWFLVAVFIGVTLFCFYWAFFLAWRGEFRRSEKLKDLVIKELVSCIESVCAQNRLRNVQWGSDAAEEKYYYEKIESDPELINEALKIWKSKQRRS